MRVYNIIAKKRDGLELTSKEIYFLIEGFINGTIHDYQMAAWSMAVYFQGLSEEETIHLTKAMVDSGDVIDLSLISGTKVDKHSTGGVGDSTTLILVPLLAAAGIPVVKMSGGGLGHTGGTIDKLDAIPGFKTELEPRQLMKFVNQTGAVIARQSGKLVPADKKLYALRDVTATVDIKSLIASSIMSKKIAAGADKILLDVKIGKGAFMHTIDDALELSNLMVKIGKKFNRETVALITNMDQPLGNSIGNSLEVKEAILTLKGDLKGDLYQLSIELATEILLMSKTSLNKKHAKETLLKLIDTGKAIDKFAEIISNQGGNPQVLEDLSLLGDASNVTDFKSSISGYIWGLDAGKIGSAAKLLGAGREYKDQDIFLEVGIKLNKRIGQSIETGESIAEIHSRHGYNLDKALDIMKDAVLIKDSFPELPPLIYDRIS